MKIAILETCHFQYGLTQSELFKQDDKIFFVTSEIKAQMEEYDPRLCDGEFIVINSVGKDYQKIIDKCNAEKIDLLLVSPIFHDFKEVLLLGKEIKCKKAITIHNLNTWIKASFRSLESLKEKFIKRKVVAVYDYIIVEDFIYNYVTKIKPSLSKKFNFAYLPYTIFHPDKTPSFQKKDTILKVVLPGTIHRDRRRYEEVLSIILQMASEKKKIHFSFAGRPLEDYGRNVIKQLDKANEICPGIASYFPDSDNISPTRFLEEMETSDIVLSTSTKIFTSLGTTEYIGRTKPTAAIHDMITFQLPGLMPEHLSIPEKLKGSVFNYKSREELYSLLNELIESPEKLNAIQIKARENSLNFTPEKIRVNLPF